jgi:1,2-diacylglycerol 3-alpha-glucosyltransferase
MKIVMLCDFYNESLEYQENLLTKYYTKHGHDVTVIASTYDSVFDLYSDNYDNKAPARTYYDGKAKIIKLKYRFKVYFKLMNRIKLYTPIWGILNQESPDIIYVHDIMPNLIEIVKYKKQHPSCKIIIDYHADYTNSGKNWLSLRLLHGIIRRSIIGVARNHVEKYFPITPGSARFLHEVYNVPLSSMELLPLGADTDLGSETRALKKGSRLRNTFGIKNEDIVIFTGGKIAPAKRTELLIEAFKKLQSNNLHLFILGKASLIDREYENRLHSMAKDVAGIHFPGWVNSRDIYAYLDMADLAVFPASQSILWQQAISMGLPLIVGDIGGQSISYLNLYNNIITLEKQDINVNQLTFEIKKVIEKTELRREMQIGAERVTSELLNWDKLILQTLRANREEDAQSLAFQLNAYADR